MNEQNAFALQIIDRLDQSGIPHMLTGSFAGFFHGYQRLSYDLDFVIDPDEASFLRYIESFGEGFYLSVEKPREAWRSREMFNIIHLETIGKADMIFCKSDEYGRLALRRRTRIPFEGRTVCVISPEDLILNKLDWARMSESKRQMEDSQRIAFARWEDLDSNYLRIWAAKMGISDDLEQTLEGARELL